MNMLSGIVLHQAHVLTIQLPRDTVGEAVTWLCENVGKFSIHDHTSDAYRTDCEVLSRMTVEFESHADAAKFKLRWANGS